MLSVPLVIGIEYNYGCFNIVVSSVGCMISIIQPLHLNIVLDCCLAPVIVLQYHFLLILGQFLLGPSLGIHSIQQSQFLLLHWVMHSSHYSLCRMWGLLFHHRHHLHSRLHRLLLLDCLHPHLLLLFHSPFFQWVVLTIYLIKVHHFLLPCFQQTSHLTHR